MRGLPQYHAHHQQFLSLVVILWGLTLIITALLYWLGPPLLPLWYSLVIPEEQLAAHEWVWSIEVMSTALLLFAFWFGRRTSLEHDDYLTLLTMGSALALQSLLLVALLRIVGVVL